MILEGLTMIVDDDELDKRTLKWVLAVNGKDYSSGELFLIKIDEEGNVVHRDSTLMNTTSDTQRYLREAAANKIYILDKEERLRAKERI